MRINATIVLPVKVSIDIPGPLENIENLDNSNLSELWANWRIKVLRKLFAEGEYVLKHTSPKAKISTCSLTELEGEIDLYSEEDQINSLEEEMPPTVKAIR